MRGLTEFSVVWHLGMWIARVAAGGARRGPAVRRSPLSLRLRCGAWPEGGTAELATRAEGALRSDSRRESDDEGALAPHPQAKPHSRHP